MKYIVYQTTNKINNKIYVGIHKTENPDIFDGYLGDGAYNNRPNTYNKAKTHFHLALMKYGVSNFYRQTLKVFDTLDDAKKLEEIIVDENFIKRTDTYNMILGGGMPPILNKIVYQFDLLGNLIKEWDSVKSVIEHYKCNAARIRMCVSEKRSFDNCYWNYENKIENISEYRLSSRGYIFLYNSNGEYINFFENASIASAKLDINRDTIVNAVFAKHLCHGYYFLKADENIETVLNFKNSRKNLVKKTVFRYTLDGKFDKEYSSIKEAELDTKCNHSNIIRAIKNNKTSGGYKWSYIKSDTIQLFSEQLTPVKVALYDKEHNLIKIWDSLAECQKEFPYCRKVCRGEKKSTGGYVFEYIS